MAAIKDYTAGYNRAGGPPYEHAKAITPADDVPLEFITSAIYVGGAGALTVVTLGGETVTFPAVPVGTVLPVRAVQIRATSTVATNIVALG